MAAPNPNDFPINRRPPSLGEFIRMKRVARRRRKTRLGVKKLINRIENKLLTGEKIQGSVCAAPSAPSHPDDDSDRESWGSDFDEDENVQEVLEEPQEEMENTINDMLEAARERNRKFQNPQHEPAQRHDAHLSTEQLGLSSDPNAPPLPPRNPVVGFSVSPVKRNSENTTSQASSTPGRGISAANVNPPARSTTPAVPQTKQPTHDVTLAASPLTTTSKPSTSGMGDGARLTSKGPAMSDSPLQATPQQASQTFPPDVTNISNNSPVQATSQQASQKFPPDVTNLYNNSSAFPRLPSVIAAVTAGSTSPAPGEQTNASNLTNNSQVGNPQKTKLLNQVLAEPSKGPNETSVPPPLPSRPPPIRPRSNTAPIKNSLTPPPAATSSASKARNDAVTSNRQPLPAAKSHIPKDASSSPANLPEHVQNSSISESPKLIASPTENLSAHDVVKLPRKSDPKRKSLALGMSRIIKELDAAVLKQVIPKGMRNKSASIGEMEHGLEETQRFVSSEGSSQAETANPLSDEYLNPKEITAGAINEKPEEDLELPAANDEVFGQPWYHPVTWTQAQFQLTTMAQDGAFLVRPSSRGTGGVPFTISVFFRGRIINCHISSTPEKKYVLGKLKPNQKTFDTITELIRYYQSTPAELKISDAEPISKVCLLITPPRNCGKIYADV